ncbi:MAG: GNAT family N-acetyltransferase [Planctomycetota bacterium]
MSGSTSEVRLYPVGPDHLPALFEMQCDPESNQMAFTRPLNQADFFRRWERILADSSVLVRAVVAKGWLAGWVTCFECDGQQHVGYWIGRRFWGLGIATRSLRMLLAELKDRPLYARVAIQNAASIRVLEKCGFRESGRRVCPASERYLACEEVEMCLRESAADNLFSNLPDALPDELVEVLARSPHARIERIVSAGHRSPNDFWYDQDESEWVVVLSGAARLRFDDGSEIEMHPGDHLLIPSGRRHRVEWTSDKERTVWLAVFFS